MLYFLAEKFQYNLIPKRQSGLQNSIGFSQTISKPGQIVEDMNSLQLAYKLSQEEEKVASPRLSSNNSIGMQCDL